MSKVLEQELAEARQEVERLKAQMEGLLPHDHGHSDLNQWAKTAWDAALNAHVSELKKGDPGPRSYILKALQLAHAAGLEAGRREKGNGEDK